MPLGKYYCDYCDKQFQDTAYARKRHLQGIQHQRAKALWYSNHSLRDPNQIYQDSFGKGVCNRFVRTGLCPYGDACKYLHPKQNLQGIDAPGTAVTNFMEDTRSANNTLGNRIVGGACLPDSSGIWHGNLPPSLRPPPEGGYPSLPFVDWG